MDRKYLPLMLALMLAAGLAGHALRGEPSTHAAAPRAVADSSDLQWEYCAVVKA